MAERIKATGEFRRQYTHAIDIVPTLYECLGVELPDVVNGYTQKPLEGTSFRYSFDDADAANRKETQFYSMLGTRAIWHKGWKAATAVPAAPESWGDFHLQKWELFDTEADPSECHDLAEQHPDKLQELIALWWTEAGGSRRCRSSLAARSRSSAPSGRSSRSRGRATSTTRAAPRSRSRSRPNIRNRSYTIAAEVEIETPEAGGVIFSQGSRFGGHALYVKDGKLKYVYNWVGELRADRRVRRADPDRSRRPLRLVREGRRRAADRRDAQPPHPRQEGRRGDDHDRSPASSGSAAAGSSSDAPGPNPSPTTTPASGPGRSSAGRSSASSIDVSGESFVDLAKEAQVAFARQ